MTKQLNPEGLEAAEVAFYGRHEKGFICKPLIADENGRYDLAKAITTYLSVTPAVDLPGLEVEPVAWVSFAEGEPSLTGNEAELKKLMAIGPGPHAFYPASAIEKLRAERDGAQTKADDANELLGWVILSLPSGYGPGERGQGPVQGVKGLRARAETAEASVATLTARAERAEGEKRAVITLLYTDEVFVGSHWESFPDADKGIWPALCAQVYAYGADGEEIPADELIPLANLVDQFGRDAVQAWVCHRRGLEKPQKGNLTEKGAKALAHLKTLTKENDNGR